MEPSLALTGPVKSNYSQIPDTLKKLIHQAHAMEEATNPQFEAGDSIY